jgi:hypothetical protein
MASRKGAKHRTRTGCDLVIDSFSYSMTGLKTPQLRFNMKVIRYELNRYDDLPSLERLILGVTGNNIFRYDLEYKFLLTSLEFPKLQGLEIKDIDI